ncbi:D-hexose-6-phosphate mutarotase [Methylogaea oryzae]|uniref:Putative glucose-6-phosphate 1-epimerase n=1 Tax=Methylogaea oryzae TaxID=1295382 RepID=A0A8D4VU86_9GAMM|nr:D-hexose-6-phosphate mutarotase [Methylogaea oryzae]BBL72747.1 D-hexose-6-phosphate mutarotase [Methylogaea oryzae]
MTDIAALNARHGGDGAIAFTQDAGGLVLAEVANAQARATLALQGAQLTTWSPAGEPPVLWLSPGAILRPGKAIRGGVPLCWPWFGAHPSEAAFPAHGFARTALWEVAETGRRADGATCIALRLPAVAEARAWWPHAFELELRVTVGTALELELVTRNTGGAAFTVGTALHAYFAVSDVRRVALHGLEGLPYLDKLDGGRRKRQSGPLTVAAELDRIYLDSAADCVIDDPGLARRIRIEKRGSRSTVVWNPWRDKAAALGDMGGDETYLGMLCVESANAADDVATVAPGGEHRLWVRYGVERD